jgi:hypothetical protein
MKKTNDTPNLGHTTLEDHRALVEDTELDAVTGGTLLSNLLRMLEDTNKAIMGNIRV